MLFLGRTDRRLVCLLVDLRDCRVLQRNHAAGLSVFELYSGTFPVDIFRVKDLVGGGIDNLELVGASGQGTRQQHDNY